MSDVTTTPEPEEPEESTEADNSDTEVTPLEPIGQVRFAGFRLDGVDLGGLFNPYTSMAAGYPMGPKKASKPAEDPDSPKERMYGMQVLKDMSRKDMIEELMHHFRVQCEDLTNPQLVHNVVHARLQSYSQRLQNEARECSGGFSIGGD
jgi:hypothetical protein